MDPQIHCSMVFARLLFLLQLHLLMALITFIVAVIESISESTQLIVALMLGYLRPHAGSNYFPVAKVAIGVQ